MRSVHSGWVALGGSETNSSSVQRGLSSAKTTPKSNTHRCKLRSRGSHEIRPDTQAHVFPRPFLGMRIREIWPICAHDASLCAHLRRRIARSRADFAQFSEIRDNRETDWWSGMDSNSRYRFLNLQPTTFRRRLQHSDGSRWARIGRFGKSLDPGAPFGADRRSLARSPVVVIFPAPPAAGAAQLHRSAPVSHRGRALACRGSSRAGPVPQPAPDSNARFPASGQRRRASAPPRDQET
jgi:hypothetical protein